MTKVRPTPACGHPFGGGDVGLYDSAVGYSEICGSPGCSLNPEPRALALAAETETARRASPTSRFLETGVSYGLALRRARARARARADFRRCFSLGFSK
jgi:hypothetical protein